MWWKDWREVERELNTDVKRGLSSDEAKRRLEKYGLNVISRKKKISPFKLFLKQFNDPLVFILIGAALISLFNSSHDPQSITDFILIVVILLLNAIFGFFQEYKAEKALEALEKYLVPKAKVIRDGKVVEIPSTELVPGDIVIISEGDAVPADLRLFYVEDLRIDESLLTGESYPVTKSVEPLPRETILPERHNMAYMGTFVVGGVGRGIVVATGSSTEIGKIAKEIREIERKTHIQEELENLASFIGKTVLGIAALIFLLNIQGGFFQALLIAVSLAVAAVPEGLPAVATIALSLGVRRMAKKKAIVRRLRSIEALGAVDVICVDKTGTITQNRMKVVEYMGDERELALIAYFCNSMVVKDSSDPTDRAIYEFAKRWEAPKARLVKFFPFDSKTRSMRAIVEVDGKTLELVKGALETIEKECKIGEEERRRLEEWMERGYRVIAARIDSKFVGAFALLDPPRKGVKEAVKKAKEAGIRVVMITGDHAKTAKAIAQMVGIEGDVLTGYELEKMSAEELEKVVEKIGVFARVTPQHKPRIVKALKKHGHVVAMTGDGVNDAVALKMADVGIAMGSGTEVAKEAADIVLLDNSFVTIINAIEEGRRILENIKKFVVYLISANIGEVFAVSVASLFGEHILRPVHLLWINLLTDGPPATALAVDPADPSLMKQPPIRRIIGKREKVGSLVTGTILGVFIILLYFFAPSGYGQTVALTGFVFMEIARLEFVRRQPVWTNKWLVIALLCVILLQIGAIYLFPQLLALKPLSLGEFTLIVVATLAFYAILKLLRM